MANVKYGGGVIQISGSIAGTVFARNRFGNYCRPRTKPVNPNSIRQSRIRTILATLSERWHTTLDSTQRSAWNTYAAAIAMKNRLGEVIYLTGFNHYIRSNVVRFDRLDTYKDDGPTVLALPEKDATFGCLGQSTANKVSVSFNKLLPWYTDTGSQLVVFQGQPQLVTRNFFGGPWACIGGVSVGEDSPKLLNATFACVTGHKGWYYGRIMRADGRLSEPFVTSSITTPP